MQANNNLHKAGATDLAESLLSTAVTKRQKFRPAKLPGTANVTPQQSGDGYSDLAMLQENRADMCSPNENESMLRLAPPSPQERCSGKRKR